MSKSDKFPYIDEGSCDGLGCGWLVQRSGDVRMQFSWCWCAMYKEMKIAYQEHYDEAWNSSGTATEKQRAWEASWRFAEKQCLANVKKGH